MIARRKQVVVRMPPDLHATVKAVARRVGLSVNDYIVSRVSVDATERATNAAITDRIDALETALAAALGDRDEHLSEALDALAERVGAAPAVPKDGPRAATIADMHALDKSIEAVIKRETAAVQRALFAALKSSKPTGAASVPPPTTKA